MSFDTPRFASRAIVALLLSTSLFNCSDRSTGGTTSTGGQAPSAGTSAGGSTSGSGSGISGAGGATAGASPSTGGTAGGSSTGGSAQGGSSTGGSSTGGSSTGGSAQGGGSASCPASADFGNWPDKKGPLDVGKLAVNDFLSQTQNGYGTDGKAGDGYAWAFAYFGALQFTKTTNDSTTNGTLISDYAKFLASGKPLPPNGPPGGTGVDQRAFGDLPFEIFLENQDTAAKDLGLTRAEMQWSETNNDGPTKDESSTKDARWWADDMFMITGLQVFAYRATHDDKYLKRSVKVMTMTFAKLQKNDGLFWHTEKTEVYWGRANGWVAAGMTELLLELPLGAQRDAIMAGYIKQMDGLVKVQLSGPNDPGAWNQVLGATTVKPEMSCTAMFTYALTMGVKNGWLTDPKYATAARNGWLALGKRTSASGQLDQVCPGTGDAANDAKVPASDKAGQEKFYMDKVFTAGDRHGQAPLIWAARALLRADCPGRR
jgi:rhamnogalacturonyl hydrolase YesR